MALTFLVTLFVFGFSLSSEAEQNNPIPKGPLVDCTISGPYTHENLSVFLIHGKDTLPNTQYITLDEALESKKAVLYETGNVNQLNIENKSADASVYIQAGDIVKGGKQDRVISIDVVIPPKSGKISLAAYCVEQGRWRKRGDESVHNFTSSKDQLNSKGLKLAAKSGRSQQKVWEEVSKSQKELNDSLGGPVNSERSATSLQLSLEDKKVKASADTYIKELSSVGREYDDVVGYAFSINGVFNSADIYGSNALFQKLWPKLLKASAIEAISFKGKTGEHRPAQSADIIKSIEDASNGKKTEKKDRKNVNEITYETKENVMFETYDKTNKKIHINIIKK
jgi:hypothetical protein